MTEIKTNVNCASFGPYGYPCDEVVRAVIDASRPWNTQGAIEARLKVPTIAAVYGNIADTINIYMLPQASDPNLSSLTVYDCVIGRIAVFAHYRWDTTLPTRNTRADMTGTLTHELGHALGFNHSEVAPGVCGGVPYSGRATMCGLCGVTSGRARTLWRDDWDGLRSGPCAYPPAVPGGLIRVKKSTDGGSTWTTYLTWVSGSNMTPGIAWGNTGGAVNLTVQAITDVNNDVQLWRHSTADGWTWIGNMGKALAGPAIGYGNGTFLVAFPIMTTPGTEGIIRVLRSIDGGWTYSTTDQPNLLSADPPVSG